MEEYQGVRKSLWDLVKDQKRNITQLERIGTTMEQKWGLEEENGDDEGNSEKGTPLFTFC